MSLTSSTFVASTQATGKSLFFPITERPSCNIRSRHQGRLLSNTRGGSQEYTVPSDPAPGSPFHYAFPVHNLDLAKEFYGGVLGCKEGRSSNKWQDYSLHGHQIVAHWAGDDYRCQDYYNPVDGDEVPVPRKSRFILYDAIQTTILWTISSISVITILSDMGLALTVEQFHELADRVRKAGVKFIIEPHLRFEGMPGEQYTMFFKDPSGKMLSCGHVIGQFVKLKLTNYFSIILGRQ